MRSFLSGSVAAVLLILLLLYSCDAHERIGKLRREVRELKGASVSLTPGSDGYQPIRHQLGSATLSGAGRTAARVGPREVTVFRGKQF
jgi:hypothetical protein